MDTRCKLVDLERALAGGGRTAIVAGYFDPLIAAHARRLGELKSKTDRLIAVILEPPDPLLDSRARAELVAALACVDTVVIGAPDLSRTDILHEETADLARRADLIAKVRARHGDLAG